MKTSKDFIRQVSLSTMGGLIDPRLMPDYAISSENKSSSNQLFKRLMNLLKYSKKKVGDSLAGA